jgi:hypothetical protein
MLNPWRSPHQLMAMISDTLAIRQIKTLHNSIKSLMPANNHWPITLHQQSKISTPSNWLSNPDVNYGECPNIPWWNKFSFSFSRIENNHRCYRLWRHRDSRDFPLQMLAKDRITRHKTENQWEKQWNLYGISWVLLRINPQLLIFHVSWTTSMNNQVLESSRILNLSKVLRQFIPEPSRGHWKAAITIVCSLPSFWWLSFIARVRWGQLWRFTRYASLLSI